MDRTYEEMYDDLASLEMLQVIQSWAHVVVNERECWAIVDVDGDMTLHSDEQACKLVDALQNAWTPEDEAVARAEAYADEFGWPRR